VLQAVTRPRFARNSHSLQAVVMHSGCHQHLEVHYRRQRPILNYFLLHFPGIVSHRSFNHKRRKEAAKSLFPPGLLPHLASRLVFDSILLVLVSEAVVDRRNL
jgi:hypothetical protein